MTKSQYIEKETAQLNLIQAAHNADISRAKLALDNGASINLKDTSALKLTPLLCCVLRYEPFDPNDKIEINRNFEKIFKFADFLIEKGAKKNDICFEGLNYTQHANNLKRKYNRLDEHKG